MRVAALQFFPTPFELVHNLETAEQLARQAAADGARVLVLPAFFNTGYVYTPRWQAAAEAPFGPTAQWLLRLSAELNVRIGGTWLSRVNSQIFNAFGLAEPNGRLHTYHQPHPWLWERCYLEAGRAPLIAATDLGRIGLMANWDVAHPSVMEAYRGQVELMLMSFAQPRFHRAVLNFPLGKKIYLAQLMPNLVRQRETLDAWYLNTAITAATFIGAPVVQAALAGRFVTTLPQPHLSLGVMTLSQPRYWPLVGSAKSASLRATFAGGSAIVSARGERLAQVEAETGLALAEIAFGAQPNPPPLPPPSAFRPPLPWPVRLLNRVLRR